MTCRRVLCSWSPSCKRQSFYSSRRRVESARFRASINVAGVTQATQSDIDILFDVCWILSPTQIQKLISQYHVADYEVRWQRCRPGMSLSQRDFIDAHLP